MNSLKLEKSRVRDFSVSEVAHVRADDPAAGADHARPEGGNRDCAVELIDIHQGLVVAKARVVAIGRHISP